MINNKKFCIALGLVTVTFLPGCAFSPWHETLMSNEELVAANCEQLAAEEQRAADNAKHMSETSKVSSGGAIFLAILEGVASVKTNTPMDAKNSSAMNSANESAEHTKQSVEFENRRSMISTIRSKKGCS